MSYAVPYWATMSVAEASSCVASCNQTWNLLRKERTRIGLPRNLAGRWQHCLPHSPTRYWRTISVWSVRRQIRHWCEEVTSPTRVWGPQTFSDPIDVCLTSVCVFCDRGLCAKSVRISLHGYKDSKNTDSCLLCCSPSIAKILCVSVEITSGGGTTSLVFYF